MLRKIVTTRFKALNFNWKPNRSPTTNRLCLRPLTNSTNLQYRQIKTTTCANNKNALDTRLSSKSKEEIKSTDALDAVGFRAGQQQRLESDKQTNVELDDLELSLGDNLGSLTFNLTWLRDSCHCQACTHQYSRQRLFTTKDFNKQKFAIKEVKILDNHNQRDKLQWCWPQSEDHISQDSRRFIEIKWADGHESVYSIGWLKQISTLYTERQLDIQESSSLLPSTLSFRLPKDDFYSPINSNTVAPVYWSVDEISASLEPIDYNDLTDAFDFSQFNDATFINANSINDMSSRRLESMYTLARQLVTYGLGKIVNVPQAPGQVLNVVRSLAYERPTGYGTVFDVVVEPSEEINLAYSAQEFDLHSDLTYRETSPGVQLLHCIRNSTVGGLSYFSDAFKAAKQLRELDAKLFEVLVKFPATFVVRDPYRDVKFRRQQPVLALDFQNNLTEVCYSQFMLPPIGHKDDVKLFYLALDKFTQLLQSSENKLIAKMEPGDLFIFHNRRVLHGRSSYDPTLSKRFLQGCYMDWDEIKCLYEKLHSSPRKCA